MTYLVILLGTLAVAAVAVTIIQLRFDGYRRRPTTAVGCQQHPGHWQ